MPSLTSFNLNFLTQSPVFLPLLSGASAFVHLNAWPTADDFNLILQKNPVTSRENFRVVEQDTHQHAFHEGYEQRLFLKNELQTRTESWHDFFNFLVWTTFPKTKSLINQLQFQDAKQQHELHSKQRTPLQNRLTLFDENGIVIVCRSPELISLLKNREWKKLFWLRRDEVKSHMRFFIIGHSIYEKMLSPYIGMTAHGVILSFSDKKNSKLNSDFFHSSLAQQIKIVDEFSAEYLSEMSGKEKIEKFSPLPVLGIPGWDEQNEKESYYENASYFRS